MPWKRTEPESRLDLDTADLIECAGGRRAALCRAPGRPRDPSMRPSQSSQSGRSRSTARRWGSDVQDSALSRLSPLPDVRAHAHLHAA
eukprot:5315318-Prymnesium_polylepis.1